MVRSPIFNFLPARFALGRTILCLTMATTMGSGLVIAKGGDALENPYLTRYQDLADLVQEQDDPNPAVDKKHPHRTVHVPSEVQIKPHRVALAQPLVFLPDEICGEQRLDLNLLTPHILKRFKREELKKLLTILEAIPVRIKWKDQAGEVRSGRKGHRISHDGWDDTNAAAALIFSVGVRHKPKLFAKMLAQAPDVVVTALAGEAMILLDSQIAAKVLVKLLDQVDPTNSYSIAAAASKIVHVYIGYWAKRDPDQLIISLTRLVLDTATLMGDPKHPYSVKQKGVLLGALISGAMTHSQAITAHDVKRLWIINSISNLVWASTTFIGAAPIAATISASVAGTVSLGVVLWAVICNKTVARDFVPSIHDVQGHIEFSALQWAEDKPLECKMEMQELLSWMSASIHIMGLAD